MFADFPYNEYLVIVSWKQLLHFLHIDWQVRCQHRMRWNQAAHAYHARANE